MRYSIFLGFGDTLVAVYLCVAMQNVVWMKNILVNTSPATESTILARWLAPFPPLPVARKLENQAKSRKFAILLVFRSSAAFLTWMSGCEGRPRSCMHRLSIGIERNTSYNDPTTSRDR